MRVATGQVADEVGRGQAGDLLVDQEHVDAGDAADRAHHVAGRALDRHHLDVGELVELGPQVGDQFGGAHPQQDSDSHVTTWFH
jgi:hypothetical protein